MKETQKRKLGYLLMVIVNAIIIFGLYRVLVALGYFKAVFIVYTVLFTGITVGYLIYNRAMSRKGLTMEMLPDAWDEDKKRAYLADGERRLERSKWVLTLIIPFVLTMAYDVLDLFVLDSLKALFSFS